MARRPTGSGRQRLFTQQQELAIVNLVRANNAIRLHQLQQQILADQQIEESWTWMELPSLMNVFTLTRLDSTLAKTDDGDVI